MKDEIKALLIGLAYFLDSFLFVSGLWFWIKIIIGIK